MFFIKFNCEIHHPSEKQKASRSYTTYCTVQVECGDVSSLVEQGFCDCVSCGIGGLSVNPLVLTRRTHSAVVSSALVDGERRHRPTHPAAGGT